MNKEVKVAVLGATGYVGIELVKILINHPHAKINFLGCENININKSTSINSVFNNSKLPNLSFNDDFDPIKSELVFLALPHGVSHNYINKYYKKIKIIDLSADFRLDSLSTYKKNYNVDHSCPELLEKFIYGLPEINQSELINNNNISVPGCYPTSILLPLIPLIKNDLIKSDNIIIDSKSGYSGAGKKFDKANIENDKDYNFYNYKTNSHQHICEIHQELQKYSKNLVKFSFNPHILPNFRGIMSTIYCDLNKDITITEIKKELAKSYNKMPFILLLNEDKKADFFEVQYTNNCLIKIFDHQSDDKIILVSLIDNLIKGAAGQAIQCFNLSMNFDENLSLTNLNE